MQVKLFYIKTAVKNTSLYAVEEF